MSARRAVRLGAPTITRVAVAVGALAAPAALTARTAAAHDSPTIALRLDTDADGRVVVSQIAGPKALVAFTAPERCAREGEAAEAARRPIVTATDLPLTLRCAPGWARGAFVFLGLGAHAQAVTIRVEGAYASTHTVYAYAPAMRVDGDAPRAGGLVAPFVAGAWHVARGLDHLALVALLAAAAARASDLLVPLVGFTVAHALTLGLAAFGHPVLSPRLAELLVAATLVLGTAFAPGDRLAARAAAAFGFGLVHGVAFLEGAAPLLARSEAPLRTLAAFHAGIEGVQLAVALALTGLFRAAAQRALGDAPLRRALALAAGSYGFALFLARLA